MYRTIGPTSPGLATPSASIPNPPITSIGNGPFSMNRAVIKPHAMNAAMFGMIIPDRNVPNFCTAIRVPLDFLPVGAASVLTMCPLSRVIAVRIRSADVLGTAQTAYSGKGFRRNWRRALGAPLWC